MKQRTIDRISANHDHGQFTTIGKYSYNLQFNPMDGNWWIVRCPVGREHDEYITVDGLIDSYWQWLEPVTITD